MLKVFLVEDECLIREGLKSSIPWEQYGYQLVGDAQDGEMALPLIRKTKPDVLITDIKMPFMDGLSLSRIVSAEFPKTKIIIISGHDDFSYAKQAIQIGVDQYLLKPITRLDMKNVLLEMKEKIAQDMEQDDFSLRYRMEMREYEQFSRRHFFERLLEGELSVEEIYEEANKLDIDLSYAEYNLLFLCLKETKEVDKQVQQEEVLNFFLRNPECVVFGWNIGCFGILLKAQQGQAGVFTERMVEQVKRICEGMKQSLDWHLAIGEPVDRLSQLSVCFQKVNHYLAYRFLLPGQHIFSEETLSDYLHDKEEKKLTSVEPAKMNPDIIREFLERGNRNEIHDFTESYLHEIKDALESRMFRDYVVLNIRFAAIAFVESLGISQEEYLSRLNEKEWEVHMDPVDVEPYVIDMLRVAIEMKGEKNESQSGPVLRRALEYIDNNFDKDLSLNKVAEEVNVSANYLSSVFSQSMQKTFIEYITAKRMEKAKKLLRSTDASTSEISQMVGYKDSHYFSFVFKKTQGLSPREYRSVK